MRKADGRPWKGRAYLRKKYPLSFPLSESQLEVLDGLARNSPINPHQLSERIRKAYSFVFNTLKELELRRMVTVRREKNEKGIYAKIYDLALDGVMLILQREMNKGVPEKKNRSFILKIIEKHRALLPLVFGKWRYLSEAGFENVIMDRLKITVDTHKSNPFRRGTGFYNWLEMEQQITRFFFLFDISGFHASPLKHSGFKAWITALKKDEEIKALVVQELEYDQRELKNAQVTTEEIISFMKLP